MKKNIKVGEIYFSLYKSEKTSYSSIWIYKIVDITETNVQFIQIEKAVWNNNHYIFYRGEIRKTPKETFFRILNQCIKYNENIETDIIKFLNIWLK